MQKNTCISYFDLVGFAHELLLFWNPQEREKRKRFFAKVR